MTGRSFDVPDAVRMRAASLGPAGVSWLESLAEIVAHLEQTWALTVGRVLTGGSESLTAEAAGHDGAGVIVKIGLPGSADLAREASVYRLAEGRGYARLYAHDAQSNALLLERLGEPLADLEPDPDVRHRAICDTLLAAWIPLADTHGLMTGAEKARWLMDFIAGRWQRLDRPCSERTVERALAFAAQRADAHAHATAVLVHGDAHAFNTLAVPGTAGTYAFVDPDGLCAEPACDLAVPMRDDNEVLLHGRTAELAIARCEALATVTGVSRDAIWQWGFVERVSTGLSLWEIGMMEEATLYLTVADRLVEV